MLIKLLQSLVVVLVYFGCVCVESLYPDVFRKTSISIVVPLLSTIFVKDLDRLFSSYMISISKISHVISHGQIKVMFQLKNGSMFNASPRLSEYSGINDSTHTLELCNIDKSDCEYFDVISGFCKNIDAHDILNFSIISEIRDMSKIYLIPFANIPYFRVALKYIANGDEKAVRFWVIDWKKRLI